MASGDSENAAKFMTFSGCSLPVVGALIDYVVTSVQYLISKTFTRAERLHVKKSQISLTPIFVLFVCLLLGLVCNIKFEVVMLEELPLSNDLHFMLMSKEDILYIDDIDTSRVILCLEASDALVIIISSLLICISSYAKSPLSEYLFLPWLGATLRGVFLRQAPTAGALLYTMAVINGKVNPLFLSTFCFLLMLESRLWLEMARVVLMRWERRDDLKISCVREVETLWSNDDVQSVEVENYVY